MSENPEATRISAITDALVIVLFLIAIMLPLADRMFDLDRAPPLHEQRVPAPLPELPDSWAALRQFPPAFERYWNDTFGFRRALVRWYNHALVRLGTSPVPDKVTIGLGGWLFYMADGALDEYRGLRPFSAAELSRWQHVLEARRDWLADRGIPYLFVIAPNKETIYPEKMPWRIRRGRTHRLDELLDYLHAHSDFEVVDPRARLQSAKRRAQLYWKGDSHWNAHGAFLVTHDILRRLRRTNPKVRPFSASAVTVGRLQAGGDLIALVAFDDIWLEEGDGARLVAPRARATGTPTNVTSWTEVDDPTLPRGIFFNDSFGRVQNQFLAERFSRLRYVWQPVLDPTIVEDERAQIVIQEMVERFLLKPPPQDSAWLDDNSRVRAAFAASSTVLLDVPRDPRGITALDGASVDPTLNGDVAIRVDGPHGSTELASVDLGPDVVPTMRVVVESSGEGALEVYYQTREAPTYDGSRRAWWPLRPGRNVAWFVLAEPEVRAKIRLDFPGPGIHRLTAVEIRAVPRDTAAAPGDRRQGQLASPQ